MEEPYPEIFSGYINNMFELFSCFLVLIVGIDLQFAVIKTINEDKYNTLLDSLLKSGCYARILLNVLFFPLDPVRFWVGPIPEIVSELGISVAAALVMVSLIQHSEMQALRILYATVWKTFGTKKDGFFLLFCNLYAMLFGGLYFIAFFTFEGCRDYYRHYVFIGVEVNPKYSNSSTALRKGMAGTFLLYTLPTKGLLNVILLFVVAWFLVMNKNSLRRQTVPFKSCFSNSTAGFCFSLFWSNFLVTFIFFVSYLPELYLLSQDIENLDLHVFPFDLMFLAATRVPGIANTFGPSISLYCTGDSKYKNIFKNSHICNLALFRST